MLRPGKTNQELPWIFLLGSGFELIGVSVYACMPLLVLGIIVELDRRRSDRESRPALVDPDKEANLFKTIVAPFPGARFDDVVGLGLRFVGYTAARPGKVAAPEWTEINFGSALWTMPLHKVTTPPRACKHASAMGRASTLWRNIDRLVLVSSYS
jgi:hypothetical protein